MKQSTRNFYTLLSVLPGLLFIIFFSYSISFFLELFRHMDEIDHDPQQYFPVEHFTGIIVISIIFGLVCIAALIVFIIHLINNKSLSDGERIVWIIVFLLIGIIGYPIYWFMRGIHYNPEARQSLNT